MQFQQCMRFQMGYFSKKKNNNNNNNDNTVINE